MESNLMQCKIKVLKHLEGVYSSLQPEVGRIYDAQFHDCLDKAREIAVITINNKLIALRKSEFERVEE